MAWSLSGRLDATEFAPPLCRRQPRLMTRAHLLIGTGQGCWLDDEGAPPGCHRVDDGGLTPASHRYARVIAR